MKLAVVGSARYVDESNINQIQRIINEAVEKYQPTEIVSGGAEGVDTMAEETAKRLGIIPTIFRPTIRKWDGKGGFKERNFQIASHCDALIRVHSKRSRSYGSGWTRDRAKEQGKPTEDFEVC